MTSVGAGVSVVLASVGNGVMGGSVDRVTPGVGANVLFVPASTTVVDVARSSRSSVRGVNTALECIISSSILKWTGVFGRSYRVEWIYLLTCRREELMEHSLIRMNGIIVGDEYDSRTRWCVFTMRRARHAGNTIVVARTVFVGVNLIFQFIFFFALDRRYDIYVEM